MRFALALGVCGVALLAGARRADAGRTYYGWLYGTELNPERGVELETWLFEQDGQGAERAQESGLWWGPTIGVTDHFELAIPVQASWTDPHDGMTPPRTTLDRFGAELRYRPDSPDPLEAGCWTSMYRFALQRDIPERDAVRAEADAVVAWQHDRVHAEADLGAAAERHADVADTIELHPGAGVSIEVTDELRVGAEGYAEIALRGETSYDSWVVAGPNLAWTHGRFWLSGSFGIGLYQIRAAPRVNFAVAF